MLARRTSRIYCDVEDLQYTSLKLDLRKDECIKCAEDAGSDAESMDWVVKAAKYAAGCAAIDIILEERTDNVNDFMVKFERKVLGKYVNKFTEDKE